MTSSPEPAPLPEDPWELPEPGDAWASELARGLAALGLVPSGGAIRAMDAHSRLLAAWTSAINLTAIRDPGGIARLHLVDSLTAVPVLRREGAAAPSILDLGSGGGMPGLPLAVVLPASRVALVDSIAKKARFLDVAGRAASSAMTALGERPPRIEALVARAEALGRTMGHRAAWDVVTARAVGTVSELVELAMPLLRVGGLLVCWKREDASDGLHTEIGASSRIAQAVGAGPARLLTDPDVAIPGHRLVVLRKERATPDRFPRAPAERRRAVEG